MPKEERGINPESRIEAIFVSTSNQNARLVHSIRCSGQITVHVHELNDEQFVSCPVFNKLHGVIK
jgi:hypothetical protein